MSLINKSEQSKILDSKATPIINNHRFVDKNIQETLEWVQYVIPPSFDDNLKCLQVLWNTLEKAYQDKGGTREKTFEEN